MKISNLIFLPHFLTEAKGSRILFWKRFWILFFLVNAISEDDQKEKETKYYDHHRLSETDTWNLWKKMREDVSVSEIIEDESCIENNHTSKRQGKKNLHNYCC